MQLTSCKCKFVAWLAVCMSSLESSWQKGSRTKSNLGLYKLCMLFLSCVLHLLSSTLLRAAKTGQAIVPRSSKTNWGVERTMTGCLQCKKSSDIVMEYRPNLGVTRISGVLVYEDLRYPPKGTFPQEK